MRIHRLTTGRVRGPRRPHSARRYVVLDWSEETLPVNAFLVEHPAGLCLVDTGQSATAAAPGYLPRWHPFLRIAQFELEPEDEAAAQLRRIGVLPDEVRWVVLTHLHTDHVGGLADFACSEVIVSEVEWERSRGLRGRLAGYVAKQWPPSLVPRLVRLDGPPLGPFASSFPLVEDGSLRLVPLAGHTAGHVGVLVRPNGSGGALIGGDAAHNWNEFQRVYPDAAAFCRSERIVFLAAHEDGLPELVELSETTTIGERVD